jgi:hypothetical protein
MQQPDYTPESTLLTAGSPEVLKQFPSAFRAFNMQLQHVVSSHEMQSFLEEALNLNLSEEASPTNASQALSPEEAIAQADALLAHFVNAHTNSNS